MELHQGHVVRPTGEKMGVHAHAGRERQHPQRPGKRQQHPGGGNDYPDRGSLPQRGARLRQPHCGIERQVGHEQVNDAVGVGQRQGGQSDGGGKNKG